MLEICLILELKLNFIKILQKMEAHIVLYFL